MADGEIGIVTAKFNFNLLSLRFIGQSHHRSANHYPKTVICQLKPSVTHSRFADIETEDSFNLLRVSG